MLDEKYDAKCTMAHRCILLYYIEISGFLVEKGNLVFFKTKGILVI